MDKRLVLVFIIPLLVAVFYVKCQQFFDPDFGWHYRMGHLILTSGILNTDPFSYTMPSYPFVDHEWLDDMGIFLLQSHFGYPALALLFSLIATCSILIVTPIKGHRYWFISLLLGASVIFEFVGVRPQLVSWLMFGVLIRLLFLTANWSRARLFLPPLFFVWANLHGGFAFGVGVFFFFLIVKAVRAKRFEMIELAIGLISIGVTLINPYQLRLWGEVWGSMSDGALRSSIVEWQPAFSEINLNLLLMLGVSLPLIFMLRRALSVPLLATYLVSLFFGLSSLRNLPFLALFNITVLTLTLERSAQSINQDEGLYRLGYFCNLVGAVAVIFFLATFSRFVSGQNSLSLDSFYPGEAVSYLKSHPTPGHIFADYDWGGFLIWRLPNQKTFVDGRMPSWRINSPPSGESSDAFADYQRIKSGELLFSQVARQYHIQVILWPKDSNSAAPDLFWQLTQTIFPSPSAKTPGFPKNLDHRIWKQIYSDDKAVIYVRQSDV